MSSEPDQNVEIGAAVILLLVSITDHKICLSRSGLDKDAGFSLYDVI